LNWLTPMQLTFFKTIVTLILVGVFVHIADTLTSREVSKIEYLVESKEKDGYYVRNYPYFSNHIFSDTTYKILLEENVRFTTEKENYDKVKIGDTITRVTFKGRIYGGIKYTYIFKW